MCFAERSGFGLNALLGLNAAVPWKHWQSTKRLDISRKVKVTARLKNLEYLRGHNACNKPARLLLRMAVRQLASKGLAGLWRITLRKLIVEDLEDRFSDNGCVAGHEA